MNSRSEKQTINLEFISRLISHQSAPRKVYLSQFVLLEGRSCQQTLRLGFILEIWTLHTVQKRNKCSWLLTNSMSLNCSIHSLSWLSVYVWQSDTTEHAPCIVKVTAASNDRMSEMTQISSNDQARSLRRGQNRSIWTFSSQVFEKTGTYLEINKEGL